MKPKALTDLQQRALDKLDHRALLTGSIANELDVTREKVLRALDVLERRGLVQYEDGHWRRAA